MCEWGRDREPGRALCSRFGTARPEVPNPGNLGRPAGGDGPVGPRGGPGTQGPRRGRPAPPLGPTRPAPPSLGKGHVARLAGRPGASRKRRLGAGRRHPSERRLRAPGRPLSGPGGREDLVSRAQSAGVRRLGGRPWGGDGGRAEGGPAERRGRSEARVPAREAAAVRALRGPGRPRREGLGLARVWPRGAREPGRGTPRSVFRTPGLQLLESAGGLRGREAVVKRAGGASVGAGPGRRGGEVAFPQTHPSVLPRATGVPPPQPRGVTPCEKYVDGKENFHHLLASVCGVGVPEPCGAPSQKPGRGGGAVWPADPLSDSPVEPRVKGFTSANPCP